MRRRVASSSDFQISACRYCSIAASLSPFCSSRKFPYWMKGSGFSLTSSSSWRKPPPPRPAGPRGCRTRSARPRPRAPPGVSGPPPGIRPRSGRRRTRRPRCSCSRRAARAAPPCRRAGVRAARAPTAGGRGDGWRGAPAAPPPPGAPRPARDARRSPSRTRQRPDLLVLELGRSRSRRTARQRGRRRGAVSAAERSPPSWPRRGPAGRGSPDRRPHPAGARARHPTGPARGGRGPPATGPTGAGAADGVGRVLRTRGRRASVAHRSRRTGGPDVHRAAPPRRRRSIARLARSATFALGSLTRGCRRGDRRPGRPARPRCRTAPRARSASESLRYG